MLDNHLPSVQRKRGKESEQSKVGQCSITLPLYEFFLETERNILNQWDKMMIDKLHKMFANPIGWRFEILI